MRPPKKAICRGSPEIKLPKTTPNTIKSKRGNHNKEEHCWWLDKNCQRRAPPRCQEGYLDPSVLHFLDLPYLLSLLQPHIIHIKRVRSEQYDKLMEYVIGAGSLESGKGPRLVRTSLPPTATYQFGFGQKPLNLSGPYSFPTL
jgi:hypothetical protein